MKNLKLSTSVTYFESWYLRSGKPCEDAGILKLGLPFVRDPYGKDPTVYIWDASFLKNP